MPAPQLGPAEWLEIFAHLRRWLGNLGRGKRERQEKSRRALHSVVRAVRETQVYLRRRQQRRTPSLKREERLALRWTDLALELDELGLGKLAKRCRITGQYWADPGRFTEAFLQQAGTRLPEIEKAALALLKDLNGP